MRDWNDVLTTARALPDVVVEEYYGTPCPKLNGKVLAASGREPGSFALMTGTVEKDVLMATDPDTFWETDHYRSYPAVLVRYGTPARERVLIQLRRAWWDRADAAQRAAFGERP